MKASVRSKSKGVVLILSMIFVLIFSALAVSMASFSSINVQMAENQCQADHERACAESGLEVIRYWVNRASISGNTATSERFSQMAACIQSELNAESITNISTCYAGATITIPSVTLDSETNQSFSASITQINDDLLQVDVTGTYGSTTRTIRAHYPFGTQANTLFDFGVASRGPLSLTGNVESLPVSELPAEAQFEGLHDQTGTFIMAPGFYVSFTGNYTSLSGAITGNGIEFSGNAGGTINGSIINYSNEGVCLTGNSDLQFKRSGIEEVPAGFVAEIVLHYDPTSYSEPTI